MSRARPITPEPTGVYFVSSIILYNLAAACGLMYLQSLEQKTRLFSDTPHLEGQTGWAVIGALLGLAGLITLCFGVYYLMETIHHMATRK